MTIKGGYVLQARKTDESEISHKPPHFREIWNWIYRQANHKDNGAIKRGQCVRTIRDIQEGLCWFIGYRKNMYSKSQCENALRFLREAGMITTAKTTRGMFITVCNYDIYQDPSNYESNTKATVSVTRKQQPPDTINKNDKNDKNDKNEEEDTTTSKILINDFEENPNHMAHYFWQRDFTNFERTDVKSLINKYGIESVVEAFKLAGRQTKRSTAYVEAIIKNKQKKKHEIAEQKKKELELKEARIDRNIDAKERTKIYSMLWQRFGNVKKRATPTEEQRIVEMLNAYELEKAKEKIIELENESEETSSVSINDLARKFKGE